MAHPFQPVADPLFGTSCPAIHVQPHLAPEAQAALRILQLSAAERWPHPLHLPPARTLHVTIYPLVPTSEGFDKEAYWVEIADRAKALVQAACAGHPPLGLRFRSLKVMPAGIIAIAEEGSGLIERLRRRIVESLPPPPGQAHRRYDLVHTTLARFADARPVPASAVEQVEAVPVDLTARVERIRIFRETLFPCLAGEELASVPLG